MPFQGHRSAQVTAAFTVACTCRHQCFESSTLMRKREGLKQPRAPKPTRRAAKATVIHLKQSRKVDRRRGIRFPPYRGSISDWARESYWYNGWPYASQMRMCWGCGHDYLFCVSGDVDHDWQPVSNAAQFTDIEDVHLVRCSKCDAVHETTVFQCGVEWEHLPGAGDPGLCRRCGGHIPSQKK